MFTKYFRVMAFLSLAFLTNLFHCSSDDGGDYDPPVMETDKPEVRLAEGETVSLGVRLLVPPVGDYTVTLEVALECDENRLSIEGANTINFSVLKWTTWQNFTFTAPDNTVKDNDLKCTLVFSPLISDDNFFSGKDPADMNVTVVDNDSGRIETSETGLNLTEGGSPASFSIGITAPPAEGKHVIVKVSSGNYFGGLFELAGPDGIYTSSDVRLTFNSDNWNNPQTVMARYLDDTIAGNLTTTLSYDKEPGDNTDNAFNTDSPVNVTIQDTDQANILIGSTCPSSLTEGAYIDCPITLSRTPTANVNISVTAISGVTLSASTLAFTSGNWNTGIVLRITVDENQVDQTQGAAYMRTVTLNPSSGDAEYNGLSDVEHDITVTENDTAGVTVTGVDLTVNEGQSATYTISLNTDPAPGKLVYVQIGNLPNGVSVSPNPVQLNSSQARTVTVSFPAGNSSAVTNHSLSHSITSGSNQDTIYNGAPVTGTVSLTTVPARITLSETSLSIPEGQSRNYNICLNFAPAQNKRVRLRVDNIPNRVSVPSNPFTFTPSSQICQTVTVNSVNDNIDNPPLNGHQLTHTIVSLSDRDTAFDGVNVASLPITVTDDEVPDIELNPATSSITLPEGSAYDVRVRLTSQPAGNVTVNLSLTTNHGNDIWVRIKGTTVVFISQITFNDMNWDNYQVIEIFGVQDPTTESQEIFTLTFSTMGSSVCPAIQITIPPSD